MQEPTLSACSSEDLRFLSQSPEFSKGDPEYYLNVNLSAQSSLGANRHFLVWRLEPKLGSQRSPRYHLDKFVELSAAKAVL